MILEGRERDKATATDPNDLRQLKLHEATQHLRAGDAENLNKN
jgi:hypothetical protein